MITYLRRQQLQLTTITRLLYQELIRSRGLRTKAALKQPPAPLEHKLLEIYRFAAFGRLASGLFHDLADPLTTISLSLEELKLRHSTTDLQRAIDGTAQMRRFIEAVRRQLQHQEYHSLFSVRSEIIQAIKVLEYRARKLRVILNYQAIGQTRTYGNPIKFHQVMTNLISNAIDAYADLQQRSPRTVEIRSTVTTKVVTVTVQDYGSGIRPDDLPKIFEPFFTTKSPANGTGIGLSIVKDVIEHGFGGQIEVISQLGEGTLFTIVFPRRQTYGRPYLRQSNRSLYLPESG